MNLSLISLINEKLTVCVKCGIQGTARDVMQAPACTVAHKHPIVFAATLMLQNGIRRLPVVDQIGRVIGIVSRPDVFANVEAHCSVGEDTDELCAEIMRSLEFEESGSARDDSEMETRR